MVCRWAHGPGLAQAVHEKLLAKCTGTWHQLLILLYSMQVKSYEIFYNIIIYARCAFLKILF